MNDPHDDFNIWGKSDEPERPTNIPAWAVIILATLGVALVIHLVGNAL